MNETTRAMHLKAGAFYGILATCGNKIDYKSEVTAVRKAGEMSVKFNRDLEAYPCYFCAGWHIGRAMTAEEKLQFAS